MSDFGTMKARIADEIIRDNLTTQIESAIKTAILRYERERFWFNESRATSTTTDGEEYYELPSDFVGMDILKITINDRDYTLIPRTWQYLEDINWGSTTFKGFPEDYAIYQNQFRLYPIPNQTGDVLTLSYIKKFPIPNLDTDTSPWFVEAEDLIRTRAKFELFVHVIYEPTQAQFMKAVEEDTLTSLQTLTWKQRATNKIRPTYF